MQKRKEEVGLGDIIKMLFSDTTYVTIEHILSKNDVTVSFA